MKAEDYYAKGGYESTLIKQQGNVVIYERKGLRDEWMTDKDYSKLKPHYEVMILSEPDKYGNSKPSPSDWGKRAWTLRTLERAEEKFSEVL